MLTQEDLLFKEDQRFTQWWLWILLMGIMAIPLYGIVQQLILKEPFGDNPMPNTGLIIFALGTVAFLYFFRAIQLRTRITKKDILVSFPPFFRKKTFSFADIESAEVITYKFVGYGLRISLKYGTVYNIKGNKGLLITLKNKKRFMIGTQQPAMLQEVMRNLVPSAVTKS